jgi:hypothetical protein
MNKLSFFTLLAICFVLPAMAGCGSGDNVVIDAPAEAIEEEPALDGMSDEDYDAAMDAEMDG